MATRVDGVASVPLPGWPDDGGGAGGRAGVAAKPPALDASGRRADGRGAEEFRRTVMQVGVSSRASASGSAYVELGRTKVMAAAHGPRDGGGGGGGAAANNPLSGRLSIEYRAAPWAGGGASSAGGGRAGEVGREAAALIAAALEPAILFDEFPKSVVSVAVHVLDDDGGSLAASITAASLALADAGVPMRDVVAAAQVARVVGGGALVLDPCGAEAAHAPASLTLAVLPAADRVTQAVFAGAWGPDEAEGGVGLAGAGAAGVAAAARAALRGGGA